MKELTLCISDKFCRISKIYYFWKQKIRITLHLCYLGSLIKRLQKSTIFFFLVRQKQTVERIKYRIVLLSISRNVNTRSVTIIIRLSDIDSTHKDIKVGTRKSVFVIVGDFKVNHMSVCICVSVHSSVRFSIGLRTDIYIVKVTIP